jgi:hypothetical protein
MGDVTAAASAFGLQVDVVRASDSREIESAFGTLAHNKADAGRPGGNATGVNFLITELGSKQLGLLHELIPAAARVGLLVNPKSL